MASSAMAVISISAVRSAEPARGGSARRAEYRCASLWFVIEVPLVAVPAGSRVEEFPVGRGDAERSGPATQPIPDEMAGH